MDKLCPGEPLRELSDGEICPICFDSFSLGEIIRKIKCSHIYHKKCIDVWAEINGICPVCKVNIRT